MSCVYDVYESVVCGSVCLCVCVCSGRPHQVPHLPRKVQDAQVDVAKCNAYRAKMVCDQVVSEHVLRDTVLFVCEKVL